MTGTSCKPHFEIRNKRELWVIHNRSAVYSQTVTSEVADAMSADQAVIDTLVEALDGIVKWSTDKTSVHLATTALAKARAGK